MYMQKKLYLNLKNFLKLIITKINVQLLGISKNYVTKFLQIFKILIQKNVKKKSTDKKAIQIFFYKYICCKILGKNALSL